MSEYLSRNQFGPVLVTIDSIRPGHVNIRFDTETPVLSVEECREHEGSGSMTSACFEGISLMELADMFLWLRDGMMRLLTIRGTVTVCETRVREDIAAMLDKTFKTSAYGLHDLDHMSHRVGLQEIQLQSVTDDGTADQ